MTKLVHIEMDLTASQMTDQALTEQMIIGIETATKLRVLSCVVKQTRTISNGTRENVHSQNTGSNAPERNG